MTQPQEDEFFDSATSEFPAKEDLRDRLVAIWNTGKEGKRQSEVTGKSYPYVETVTVVLDDGPQGWTGTRLDGDPNLVLSVAESGPQRLDGFQWSATGIYSRTVRREPYGKPMIGRINSRKNKTKGMSDAWSIAECTPEDMEIARSHRDYIMRTTADLKAAHQQVSDDEAFG